jgi:predicted ArsR family transcriptional regulator
MSQMPTATTANATKNTPHPNSGAICAGLVQRRSGAEKRRGRPRLLYAPAGDVRDEDAREQLIEVLAGALAHEDEPAANATRAGRRWSEAFEPPDRDDPVPGLVGVLERLGFDPEADAGADAHVIRLRACPFRAAAHEHPEVVCAVHRGLVEQLLDGTAPQVRLIPFVEPELCLVAVERRGPVAAAIA